MEAFGEVAVQAAELVRNGACDSAAEAWATAARRAFPHSQSLQDKSCPRTAFLGLCEEGLVAGVPAGPYTRSHANKAYAVRAAELVTGNPNLAAGGPLGLWKRVLAGSSKAHNSQMHVALALHRNRLLNSGSRV